LGNKVENLARNLETFSKLRYKDKMGGLRINKGKLVYKMRIIKVIFRI